MIVRLLDKSPTWRSNISETTNSNIVGFMYHEIKIMDDVVSRSTQDGCAILMKLDSSTTFYKLNGISAQIWKELQAQKSLESILENIELEYNVERSTLDLDTKNLLQALENKQFIKLS